MRRMEGHFQALGWLMIASGALTAFGALMTFLVSAFFGGMSAFDFPRPTLDPLVIELLSAVVFGFALLLAVTAVLSIVAGAGLLQYQTWSRTVGIVAASLMLTKFPIGTAIGVYGFWVLLSQEGRAHFNARTIREEAVA